MRLWRALAVSAVLGVVTTILLAATLAALSPQSGWRAHYVIGGPRSATRGMVIATEYYRWGCWRRTWLIDESGNRPFADAIHQAALSTFAPAFLGGAWGEGPEALRAPVSQVQPGCEHATGWPLAALWYRIVPSGTGAGFAVRGGYQLPTRGKANPPLADVRAIPMMPVWTGLGLDSLLFGSAFFVALASVAVVRRGRRRRRGWCLGCGYDLGGLSAGSACPECGMARAEAGAGGIAADASAAPAVH